MLVCYGGIVNDIDTGEVSILELKRFVGTTEAARLDGVSTRTIHRWIKAGRITADRVFGRWAIERTSLPSQPEEATRGN